MIASQSKKILQWCIAPTLYISDRYKEGAAHTIERGRRVKKLNKCYFYLSLGGAIFISFTHRQPIFALAIGCYCLSRCNEIFFAFIKDVFDKLSTIRRKKNGLEYFERIQLALTSFVELIINYAILYYVIEVHGYLFFGDTVFFNKPLGDFFNAIYFSVVTIVSIGYGDFAPTHPLTKCLIMYEIMNGMLLLVVSFTVYVSLTLKE